VLGGVFILFGKSKQPEVSTSQLNQPTWEDKIPSVSNNKTSAETTKSTSKNSWQTYDSDKNGFRVKYPENWIYGEGDQGKTSGVAFYIKNGNLNETSFRVEIVAVADVPENLNTPEKILATFDAENKKQSGTVTNYRHNMVTLSGVNALHMTYNYVIPQTDPPETYISSAYFLSKNGKMYSLLIKAKTSDPSNAKVMEEIVKTFQFK